MDIDATVAIIGAGNLGGALAAGLLDSGMLAADRLRLADASKGRLAQLRKALKPALAAADNRRAAEGVDIVVLAVKPHVVGPALEGLAPYLKPSQLVISLAAAVPVATIETALPAGRPVVRAMPNIALTVGESATALCANSKATREQREAATSIFAAVGETVWVEESQMHAVTALSGSGPAYIFMVIEALAAGGVKMGLPAATASRLAAQTVAGAARMSLETTRHPAELRDQVTTPGGTTSHGLHELEQHGLRGALISAVEAATERSLALAELLGDR